MVMTRKSLTDSRRSWVIPLVLAAGVAAVFLPVLRNGFVFDDVQYITGNPRVASGLTPGNFLWSLTATYAGNWHPVTWLSHMLDVRFYGLNPAGHHLSSILLHSFNTGLLFLALKRMTGATWRSALVASLFALHPLHVESVAWVAERKDLLSAFFGLVATIAYLWYAGRPGATRYLLLAGAYALSLASKPMLVTFPFLLLLLDYWPLGRLTFAGPGAEETPGRARWRTAIRLGLEKTPLLLMAAASSVVTYVAQQREGAVQTELFSLPARLGNAVVTYFSYLGKTVLPAGLAAYYPHPGETLGVLKVSAAGLSLAALSLLALGLSRKFPYLLVGWFWYLGTLVPVIGLVQVGEQAMADRYTYIPLIGLFVAAAWGAGDLSRRFRAGKGTLLFAGGTLLFLLTVLTVRQIGYWRDNVSLFSRALDAAPENWFVHINLAGALADSGRPDEAGVHYRRAIELNPRMRAEAKFQTAEQLLFDGKLSGATTLYLEALKIWPEYPEARLGLGVAYFMMGKREMALAQYRVLEGISPPRAQELLSLINLENQ